MVPILIFAWTEQVHKKNKTKTISTIKRANNSHWVVTNLHKIGFSVVVSACEAAVKKPQLAKLRVCRYMIHEVVGCVKNRSDLIQSVQTLLISACSTLLGIYRESSVCVRVCASASLCTTTTLTLMFSHSPGNLTLWRNTQRTLLPERFLTHASLQRLHRSYLLHI